MPQHDPNRQKARRTAIHVEDAFILISIGLLFWLGVLEKHERWAKIGLLGVLVVMAVVLMRRFRRFDRAVRKPREPGQRPDQ